MRANFNAFLGMLRHTKNINNNNIVPQRNITFKKWNHSTNSEFSEDYEDIEWKPISRHQKTRKPINPSG